MAETGKKWYVLKAVSGKEAKVKEYLEALMRNNPTLADSVGQILLPTEKYAQLRNGKRVVKEKLFLPGYVLVEARLDGEITHTLRYIPNVLGFLGGMDNPSPVRQADINRILGTVEDTAIRTEEVEVPFILDEAVKVVEEEVEEKTDEGKSSKRKVRLPKVDSAKCVGCGACAHVCPAHALAIQAL